MVALTSDVSKCLIPAEQLTLSPVDHPVFFFCDSKDLYILFPVSFLYIALILVNDSSSSSVSPSIPDSWNVTLLTP